jgi:purine-cytosine permease-like protein
LATPFSRQFQGGTFVHQRQNKELRRMRLKLVLAASLLAAVVGAGACIALVLGAFSGQPLYSPGLLLASTLLLPAAAIIFASIFVYRHTARRRKLQALLTAILATLLTIALFIFASILSARRNWTEPPPPSPHIAS